ncbi:MAG: hypothetical protein QM773_02100 [Hyphomonadaceae bacterium]
MLLRLFFDAGSGVLLWAYDAEAKARFGYPVEAADLGVPPELRAEIEQLVTDYDAAFPWEDPGGPITFGYEGDPPFASRVRSLLPKLRAALPGVSFESDYEG